ncbi:MAG TPA: hypothetical protein ENN99_16265, partial [Chloroflexi bacterium]|nr:hypothetical protein [Chloroflexota bacterium]
GGFGPDARHRRGVGGGGLSARGPGVGRVWRHPGGGIDPRGGVGTGAGADGGGPGVGRGRS